jgi:hypothetical protein
MNDKPLVPRPGKTIEEEYTELSAEFLDLEERYERLVKPRIVIVDVRNGNADGRNINLPEEGQEAMLRAIETASVLVSVDDSGMWVKQGVDLGLVTMVTTKSELQMNAEKAEGEREARVKPPDDLEKGEHPVDVKMRRVWDKSDPGYVESGEPEKRGLKGF